MSRPKAAPVDRAAPFALDEMFFSMTDRKAHIRSGNEVFARVSGLEMEELLGAAHNIVRHPDMPRGVFEIFWRLLNTGRPVAAYVKNLSTDGSYYWVMAVVVPTTDGFLSVRIKPSTELFGTIRELYGELHALEREVEAGDPRNRKSAIEASSRRLDERLGALGFPGYEAFMRAAFPAEVLARQAGLHEPASSRIVAEGGDPGLRAVLGACAETDRFLDVLVATLGEHTRIGETLSGKSEFVLDLADNVRLFSLNALLAASRLGRDGAALGAVAQLMRQRSDQAAPVIQSASSEIAATVELLSDVGFRIASAKLLTEMTMVFVAELLEKDERSDRAVHDLGALVDCMRREIDGVLDALVALDRRLIALMGHVTTIDRDLAVLSTLEVNGRVEAARHPDARHVETLFKTISEQVRSARGQMTEFHAVDQLRRAQTHQHEAPAIRRHVAQIERQIGEMVPVAA